MNLDLILFLKAFLIGLIWGGSLFVLLAFIAMIFPLPSFIQLYDVLGSWAAKHPIDRAPKWYNFRLWIMRICAILFWTIIIVIYIFSFDAILSIYVPKEINGYYIFYAVGILAPSIWFIYTAFKSMLSPTAPDKSSIDQLFEKKKNPSLIDKIQRKH